MSTDPAPTPAPDAAALAAEMAPKFRELLQAEYPAIEAEAGGFLHRQALRASWPTVLAESPVLLRIGVELLAARFGQMTMGQVVAALAAIRASSGPLPLAVADPEPAR